MANLNFPEPLTITDRCVANDKKLRKAVEEVAKAEEAVEEEEVVYEQEVYDEVDIVEEELILAEDEKEEDADVEEGQEITIVCMDMEDIHGTGLVEGTDEMEAGDDEERGTMCPICHEEMSEDYKQHIKNHYKGTKVRIPVNFLNKK